MESLTQVTTFFEALLKSPFQAVVSLIIFLLALPLIMKGLRDKPAVSDPEPTPVQIESPWLVIELNTISNVVQEMRRDVQELMRAVDHLVVLIKNNNRSLN